MAALLIESLVGNKSKVQTAIWAMELIFLFAGLISTVLMVKDAVFPCSFNVVLSSLKSITISFRSWLSSPLYIGIFINFMVILIAALSTFHQRNMDSHSQAVVEDNDGVPKTALSPSSSPPPAPPAAAKDNDTTILQDAANIDEAASVIEAEAAPETTASLAPEATPTRKTITTSVAFFESYLSHHVWQVTEEEKLIENTDDSLLAVLDASYFTEASEIIKKMETLESSPQFAMTENTICTNDNHYPHEDANTEEETELQLANEHQDNIVSDEEDTMEAMWKVITEGSEKPVNIQLKKSDTCPMESRVVSVQSIDSKGLLPSAAAAWRELRKSVTFNDAISMRKRAGLVRDPSMSLDNINRRAGTFINKFNNAMKIERQESAQRYLDMINRGR